MNQEEFLVLNYLDIVGCVDSLDRITTATGVKAVADIVESFEKNGYITRSMSHGLEQYVISKEGLEVLRNHRESELTHEERAQLTQLYEEFQDLNHAVKQLSTDWQLKDVAGSKMLNDHTDPAYDFKVLSKLFDNHDRVEAFFQKLDNLAHRYNPYLTRLRSAVEKLKYGELDYFTKPNIDSYHTVWFEFHEDLLKLMGKKREE
ncbi:MAG: hypothetical protein ACE5PO_06510 [Candidatus Bathyarchaeia archaeon]